MKFDYCIGNPPYQETRETTKDMPIYNEFMDASYTVADKVELITPARFLFNAGATPKEWNRKMLDDEHFKILEYEPDSSKVFSNTDIKGGVAVSYRDRNKKFGAIETFSAYPELNAIANKVGAGGNVSLNTVMYPYSTYTLSDQLWRENPERKKRVEQIAANRNALSKQEKSGELSNLRIITTNIFDLWPEIFSETKPEDGEEYCRMLGRQNNERCYRFVKKKYIDVAANYKKYKVITPAVNGSGKISDTMALPIIGEPEVAYTQTFLGIGNVDTKEEAVAIFKYICTKFTRALLSILKITQHNPPEKWRFVPLQDFTSSSDIDWSQSVAEIDRQLYKKYGLSEKEIEFIETHVKEMS